jgi:hypothetical protein
VNRTALLMNLSIEEKRPSIIFAGEMTYFSIGAPSVADFVLQPDGYIAIVDFKYAGFMPASLASYNLDKIGVFLHSPDLHRRIPQYPLTAQTTKIAKLETALRDKVFLKFLEMPVRETLLDRYFLRQ